MFYMDLSSRLSTIPASPIRKLVPFAEAAKQSGITVYHLNIGDPDIKTPQQMIDKLTSWNLNPISYAQSQGDPEFLSSMESYYQGLGFPFITKADIQVTSGGSEAIGMVLFATCNPGDEILVFEPFYANYISYASLYGVTIVPVPTDAASGFHLPSKKVIQSYFTKKTKGILFCNPNNPTGTVYRKDEIAMLATLAEEHNIFLYSDEVYREFVYDEVQHVSILSYMERLKDRGILLDSLSKRYSLCGARLGVLVSKNEDLMQGVLRIAQGRLSVGLIDQRIAAALTQVPYQYIKNIQTEYQSRRDILYEGLCSIPGVSVSKPEGAFYCMVTLPVTNSDMFCQWLLTDFQDHQETVMIAPGKGFYKTHNQGNNQVRIAYVLEGNKLKRAIEILKKALSVYSLERA